MLGNHALQQLLQVAPIDKNTFVKDHVALGPVGASRTGTDKLDPALDHIDQEATQAGRRTLERAMIEQ